VEVFTSGPTGGLISPGGRLATFSLGLGIRLRPDPATLGPFAPFAASAACGIGPMQLSLTTGGSGDVTGVPYDPATGVMSLVDGRYGVPALTCSPLMTTLLSLVAGDPEAVEGLVAGINQTLDLPSPAGANAVVLDAVVSRAGPNIGGALLAPGGGVWPASGFGDVPVGAHFDQAVRWLKAQGITTGLGGSAVTYGSSQPVTRGQMAAFLWRLMDRRNATTSCGFSDVDTSAFFSQAVCWLKERAVTTGVGGNLSSFAPGRLMTRGEMALFLWRLVGSPTGSPAPRFTDLVDGAAYGPAVAWLAANGITTGINGDRTKYAPSGLVTRAQMASFLYRLASTPSAWVSPAMLPTTLPPWAVVAQVP